MTVWFTADTHCGDHRTIIEVAGRRLVLCRYPFRTWNWRHKAAINLHGHSHGRLTPMLRQYDVGVDPRGFAPVTRAQLLAWSKASNPRARRSPAKPESGG